MGTTAQYTESRSPNPIFIVGAPRSGTTLLRVALNRHPSIGLCDETYFFYYVYSRRQFFGDLKQPAARRRLVDRYLETHRIRRLGIDLYALSEELMQEGDSYPSFLLNLMRVYARVHGKTRYGEKTPQHALFTETLCRWYPGCRVIHVVRDPRDVVASLLRMPWASTSILTNTRLWMSCSVDTASAEHSDNCILIHYERLVAQPEAELEKICQAVGEEYTAAMLAPDADAQADAWWFQRAYGPLDRDRPGKWREQLTRNQVALIEWVAGTVMERLGYEPMRLKPSIVARTSALAKASLAHAREQFCGIPRMWYHWVRPTQLAKEEAWVDRRR